MFGATAVPEGDRGSAIADYDAGAASRDGRGGGEAGTRGRLLQRGDGGVSRRCRKEILFSGDEHAAAGGAPGDGDGDGAGPGEAAVSRGGGREAAAEAGRRDAARMCD